MALTKHQKLARGIKRLFDALEIHYQKTAAILNALQLHFYETHLLIGRPLMTERALAAMMRTHVCGLKIFSPDEKLRAAAGDSPLIGLIITPPFYLRSRVLTSQSAPENAKWVIPWGVKITLPSESLQKLEEAKLQALLYCASESEMSEWIDWFEREDKAGTLTNQLLAIGNYIQERAPIKKNLIQLAFPFFREAVLEYYKAIQFPKVFKTLAKVDFSPKEQTTVAQSYELVTTSLRMRKKRHFEGFQRFWLNRLKELIFANLDWTQERKDALLEEYFPSREHIGENHGVRWETGLSIDRQTYGAFINYFSNRFLDNPLKNQSDGEIVLLLWVMIYVSQEPGKVYPITHLLKLTTANVSDRYLSIDGAETELSCGLADLIKEYTGEGSLQRQQKLFPNLTIDRLEDSFRRASLEILPSGSTPALPEAFLTFPHPHKDLRMMAQMRRHQQENPPQIFHDPISRNELKRQLVEKSQSNGS